MATNLPLPPLQPTPLLGRTIELDTIEQRLTQELVWPLSLTGPAGVGKTRLALETRDRLVHEFPQGIILVDLTTVRDHRLVLPAMAERRAGLEEVACLDRGRDRRQSGWG